MKEACLVSILLVSFNTREMSLACLKSIYDETKEVTFEILVVDNASSDGSVTAISESFPQLRLHVSETNLGFAAANNLVAVESPNGKYLLLLNPDTVVLNGAIDTLVYFAEEHREADIFGGRTLFGNGDLNPSSCWREPSLWGFLSRALSLDVIFPNSGFFNYDSYGGWARDSVAEVDIVSGCFLLIRRELWERLGGFDPDFFMYAEDWDLCMRARRAGSRCLLCPDAEIIHYGGASEPALRGKMLRLLRSKAQLCSKHWNPGAAWLAIRLLDLWVLTRVVGYGVGAILTKTKRAQYECWLGVWAERREWHHT